MEKKANKDEIDLVELLVKGVLLVKRNLLSIIIFFIIGSGLGFMYAYITPKVYESNMMLSSGILTESYTKRLVENLNKLISEKNKVELSNRLSLTLMETEELGKFKIEPIKEKSSTEESDNSAFLITVELQDELLLPKLEKGVVNYLQDNDYVKVRVEHSKNYLKQLIVKVEEEIRSLESFKSSIYNGKFFQSTNGNVMFDPTTVNSKILDLTKEKISLEQTLELANSVQIINSFTKFDKPIWPKKSVSMIAGAAFGLFLVGLLIAFKSIRKLVNFAQEHPSQTQSRN